MELALEAPPNQTLPSTSSAPSRQEEMMVDENLSRVSRVSVLWKATGESYNAIVERLNSDGTYDVVYENSIQDKAGHEKNISADRIKFLEEEEEIYWTEDKKEEDGERSILTATEILKFDRNLEELTADDLTDEDFHQLADTLSITKVYDAYGHNSAALMKLFEVAIERIHIFEELFTLGQTSSTYNISEEDIDSKQFDILLFFIKLCVLLFRIYGVVSDQGTTRSSLPTAVFAKNLMFPEEIMEKLVVSVHDFFRQNFAESNGLSGKERSSSGSAKSSPHTNKRTKMDVSHLQKKEIQFMTHRFLPAIISLLECFRMYCRTTRPTGTTTSLFVEIAQDILQLEPLGHSMIFLLDTKHKSLLQSVQQMTISFAKTLFAHHEHSRNMILSLAISLLHSTYSNKNPYKPFLLHHQVHSESNPHVTVGFILLMTCVQSLSKWKVQDREELQSLLALEDVVESKVNDYKQKQKGVAEELLSDVQKATNQFANELLQRCHNKETQSEQYNTISQLLQELLLAIQLPTWPVAGVLLEKVLVALMFQFKKVTEIGGSEPTATSSKRDVPQINQILDLFATIAEKLKLIMLSLQQSKGNKSLASGNTNQTSELDGEGGDLISSEDATIPSGEGSNKQQQQMDSSFLQTICQHVEYKWQQDRPLWQWYIQQHLAKESTIPITTSSHEGDSYWDTEEATDGAAMEVVDEPSKTTPRGKKKAKSKEKSKLKIVIEEKKSKPKSPMTFLEAIDSFLEINKDICQILYELKASYPTEASVSSSTEEITVITAEKIQQFVEEGGIDITFQCLPHLFQSVPTSFNCGKDVIEAVQLLFQSISPMDIHFARIVKYLFEYNGSVSVQLPNTLDGNDGSIFDMILFMLISWMNQLITQPSASDNNLISSEDQVKEWLNNGQVSDNNENSNNNAEVLTVLHTNAVMVLIQQLYAPPEPTFIGANGAHHPSEKNKIISKTSLPRFLWDHKTSQSFHMIHAFTIAILEKTLLSSFFQKIVDLFLYMLHDSSPLIRTKVMKCIHKLVILDPYILLQQTSLRGMILSIVYDRSIAVREEGVKVIGYMIAHGYHDLLLPASSAGSTAQHSLLLELKPLLFDEGISVRKAILFIFRDILLHQPYHPEYTVLSLSLLERLIHPKEEESIKEHIVTIFQQLWFTPPSSTAITTLHKMLSSATSTTNLSTINAFDGICKLIQATTKTSLNNPSTPRNPAKASSVTVSYELVHIKFTAFQLIEIVSLLPQPQWILTLLQTLLHHQSSQGTDTSSSTKQRQEECISHCNKLIAFLVELLLLVEEQHELIEQYILSPRQLSWGDYKAQILGTLALFTEAHPPFITKYLLTLLPYLKQDTSVSSALNAEINGHLMKMLEVTSILEFHPLAGYCLEIIEDLVKIALSQSGKNIQSAISCLSMIILHITQDAGPYFKLIEKLFQSLVMVAKTITYHIEQYPDQPINNFITPAHSARLQRCLVVLGYLCEQGKKCKTALHALSDANADDALLQTSKQILSLNEQLAIQPLVTITEIHPRTFFGACYAAVTFSLSLPDAAIQTRAIQALCGIFTGYPRLMLLAQSTGLFGQVLSTAYSTEIHERFIVGLKEIMVAEEARLEKQASTQHMKSSGRVKTAATSSSTRDTVLGGAVDHDADATTAGFVLQQHLPQLIQCMYHSVSSLRFHALQLIATLLRQGMLCPLDILASIIALQGDDQTEIRTQSLSLLQQQDERHPGFLDNRLLEGIETMYNFQSTTFHHVSPTFQPVGDEDGMICNIPVMKLNPNNLSTLSAMSMIYITCLQVTKSRKQSFLYGLLRKASTLLLETVGSTTTKNNKQHSATSTPTSRSLLATSTVTTTTSTTTSDSITSQPSTPILPPIPKLTNAQITTRFTNLASLFPQIPYYLTLLTNLPYPIVDDLFLVLHWISRNIPHDTLLTLTHCKDYVTAYLGGRLRNYEEVFTQNSVEGLGLVGVPGGASVQEVLQSKKKSVLQQAFPVDTILTLPEHDVFVGILASTTPSPSTVAATAIIPNNDGVINLSLPWRQVCCEIATLHYQLRAYEMFLRCKSYLKTMYGVSDERCALYDPSTSTINSTSAGNASIFQERTHCEHDLPFTPSPAKVPGLEDLLSGDLLAALTGKPLIKVDGKDQTTTAAKDIDSGRKGKGRAKKANKSDNVVVESGGPQDANKSANVSVGDVMYEWIKHVVEDYNRINAIVHMDPDDFKLDAQEGGAASTGNKKGKRGTGSATSTPGGRKRSTPASTPGTVSKPPLPPTSGGKKRRRAAQSDEEEDDYGAEVSSSATKSKKRTSGVSGESPRPPLHPEAGVGTEYERKSRSVKKASTTYLFDAYDEEIEQAIAAAEKN